MSSLAHLLVLALAGTHLAHAAVLHSSEHTFTLAAKKIAPDGFPRTAALVNGQFPGPILTAQKGERVKVNVINQLSDPTMRQSTSIHWHGIFQPHNSQNDGTSFVTQCPISPHHSFSYELELGEQTGTYWYHSHLGTQYVDGIRGALVIYDPQDPFRHMYDVDDVNTVITLADWYQIPAEALLASWRNNGGEPVPDSGLVNGIGQFQGGPQVTLARINVVHGKRYRFRVIGLSADGFFDFAISNHRMTVIEADGIAHKPYNVDSMLLAPGQRYSVVVTANQTVANYWIRATHSVVGGRTIIPSHPHFNGSNTFAVLHYQGAPQADPTDPKPTTLPPGGVALEEHKLTPLYNPGLPGGEFPSDLVVFNFSFGIGAANGDVWLVNGVQYKSPSTPTLLNILANRDVTHCNTSEFNPSENTLVLPRDSTIEINFLGSAPAGGGHSFHLHGHAFDVVQGITGPPNYVNPPRRDVVQGAGTSVRVRFRTDNPGPWFVHCHIDWHLETGLAVVFAEDPAGIKEHTRPNPAWYDLCKIYDKLDPSQQ